MAWRRNQCAFEQFMDQITRIAVNCMQSLALQNETLNAQVITGKTHIRAETSALQRTFRFTPLGLASAFSRLVIHKVHSYLIISLPCGVEVPGTSS